MQNAVRGKHGRLANKTLRKLMAVPGPPVYPLRWKSSRQRRAFFATRGFGRGIPTVRTGEMVSGWRVTVENRPDGGVLVLENPSPVMPFVQGERAQPFHRDTGWVQVGDVREDYLHEAGGVVIETWRTVTRKVIK